MSRQMGDVTLTKAGMGLGSGLPLEASPGGLEELRRPAFSVHDLARHGNGP